MVDRHLAKVDYVGSIPIIRSMSYTVPTRSMGPIVCDCSECRPERLELWKATHAYLYSLPGFAEFDWEDLERRSSVQASKGKALMEKASVPQKADEATTQESS